MPVRCPSCGSELRDSARFCNGCGAKIEAPAAQVVEPTPVTAPVVPEQATAPVTPVTPTPTPTPAVPLPPVQPLPSASSQTTRSLVTALGIVVVIAAIAVVFAVQHASQSQTLQVASGQTQSNDSNGTSGDGSSNSGDSSTPSGPVVDLSSDAQLSASSELPPDSGVSYGPDNLTDGIRTTAWSEGASGVGLGEWFQFDFSNQVTVTEFHVVPGYDKHSGGVDRFWTNPQLKSFTAEFSDGSRQDFTVADRRVEQTVKLDPPVTTTSVKIIIQDTYPEHNGPHSAKDTSVSEFHVYGQR